MFQKNILRSLCFVPGCTTRTRNLAIANRSRVSCAEMMSQFDRAYMISRALKMQDKTLQDRTMADKLAWPDFAGQDNDGQEKHHA